MKSTWDLWKKEILNHKKLIAISIIFLILAVLVSQISGDYVDDLGPTAVASDLILDHIPVINLSFLYVYGSILIVFLLFLYPLVFNVKKLHVVISQFSLLIMVRGFFITLTHLNTPENAILIHMPKVYSFFMFNKDLFFSGHTAVPFLGYLLFRNKPIIGTFFLISTIVMAITVLLMHIHYSIDVFAALAITYSCFKIGEWFFNRLEKKK